MTAVVNVPPPPPSPGYRDERWYAMNLGIIASTLVITLRRGGQHFARSAAERTTRVSDQIGLWIGFILTLMVFSYLLGDNFLYRLAIYVFVGLAAGFVTMVTVESVLLPWIRATLQNGDMSGKLLGAIPLVLGLLLLLKAHGALQPAGQSGIGVRGRHRHGDCAGRRDQRDAAAARQRDGEQRQHRMRSNGFILVLGVVSTLVYFQYLARRVPGGAKPGAAW